MVRGRLKTASSRGGSALWPGLRGATDLAALEPSFSARSSARLALCVCAPLRKARVRCLLSRRRATGNMLAVLLLLRSVIALTAAQASLADAPRTNVSRAAVQPGCKPLAFLDGVPTRYACVPPRFFFIGPGSTGTNSLAQEMRSLLPAGAAVCHEKCGKELHADASSLVHWQLESQRHDVSLFARTSALGQNCMPPPAIR